MGLKKRDTANHNELGLQKRETSRNGQFDKRVITQSEDSNSAGRKKPFKASSSWTPTEGGILWNHGTGKFEYFEPTEKLSANMGIEQDEYVERNFQDNVEDNGYST